MGATARSSRPAAWASWSPRPLVPAQCARPALDGGGARRQADAGCNSAEKGSMQDTDLVIRGWFEHEDGSPVSGAAVHHVFLGDPPSNCGTYFDLEIALCHTDTTGQFRL